MDEAGKENVNLVNLMKNYQDPLLKEFDEDLEKKKVESSEEDDTSGDDNESSDEEEASDIKFPKANAPDLL